MSPSLKPSEWVRHAGIAARVAVIGLCCSMMVACAGTMDKGLFGTAGHSERFMDVKKVVSKSGVEAWLVEDHNLPILALEFSFEGGSASEPADKAGLAFMMAGLLDEGAGPYDFQAFQTKLKDTSVSLSFDADRDGVAGSLLTLTRNRDQAVELLKLAVTEPRFDTPNVEKVRSQIKTILQRERGDPSSIASKTLFESLFPDHPYNRPVKGSAETLDKITRADLEAFRKSRLTRDGLKVTAVGDISPGELKALMDEAFGGLDGKAGYEKIADVAPLDDGKLKVVQYDIPQSVVYLAGPGIERDDPDFITAYVLNYVLGGGGFSSRLMTEIREKRGLAYSAGSSLFPLEHSALFFGTVSTRNDRVNESVSLMRQEIDRVRAEGITEEELEDAKRYLTGSFALRFDSNGGIAANLLGFRLQGLGMEYVNRRNELIRAVTIEDIKRVAKKLPPAEEMTVVIVGKPTKAE